MKKICGLFFLIMICAGSLFAQPKTETLKMVWPQEYKWKIISNRQSGNQQMAEIVPQNETAANWTILGTMLSMRNVQIPQMESFANSIFAKMRKSSPNAKLTIIEKSNVPNNKWVLFKIQSPSFNNNAKPESQLYYAVQGKSALFVNFVAIKQPTLPVLFTEKWARVFKSSRLVVEAPK